MVVGVVTKALKIQVIMVVVVETGYLHLLLDHQ
jgi:hypothetical protein